MRLKVLWYPLLTLWLAIPAFAGDADTRYILAPTVFQTDPYPSEFQPSGGMKAFHGTFQRAFAQRFSKGYRPLTQDQRLDAEEPSVLVVPRLSVLRVSQDTVAGALDRFEATLVGDITLMDPWSMTRLFSATRMVMGVEELSKSQSRTVRSAAIQRAMDKAGEIWIQECLREVQSRAHPFVLQGAILPSQSGFRPKGGGGFWPFGSLEGLKANSFLMGLQGKTARVRELHPHFAVVEDPANPSRSMAPGETYHATLIGAASAAERAEPKVAIQWVGPLPSSPSQALSKPLDAVGWSGLLANYLSKAGGLRLLPLHEDPLLEASGWKDMEDELRAFSGRAVLGNADLSQDVMARKVQDEPCDILVEIGLAETYHGTTPGAMNTLDQRFHAVWGLRWFVQSGDEEPGRLLFKGVRFQPEERLLKTKEGFRDLDLDSIWFGLCRNGLIRIAQAGSEHLHPQRRLQRGIAQGNGKIAWEGTAPGTSARLSRRRALGTVRDAGGRELGTYFGKRESLSSNELRDCSQGDEISFETNSVGQLGLLPVELPTSAHSILQPEWLRARLAEQLLQLKPFEIHFLDQLRTPSHQEAPCLLLKVDELKTEALGDKLNLGATWRLRLHRSPFDPQGEPIFRSGINQAGPFPSGYPYQPASLGEAVLLYQQTVIPELVKRATTKGLIEAISKEQ